MKIFFSYLLVLIFVSGCTIAKNIGLYDQPADDTSPSINGFYALSVFSDQITTDLWYTQAAQCLTVKSEDSETKSGNGSISIEWNKQADNCPWMGMGIGWDNWTGKNFESITSSAALTFWVKMKEGQSSGLPWAVGFEDYSGGQAWTGITPDCVINGPIRDNWTQIILPLYRFPFASNDVDITSIKQVIFQFESSGKVWIDDIHFIPFKGNAKKEVSIQRSSAPSVDGSLEAGEWPIQGIELPVGILHVSWNEDFLYMSAQVKDSSPLINTKEGSTIWNGDAIEISFSTSSEADPKRLIYYKTDHHLGIRMSNNPIVYDWIQSKEITSAIVKVSRQADGYSMEMALPWKDLGGNSWQNNQTYSAEFAIDLGDEKSERTMQYRWNSSGNEGFNSNPSLWGQIHTQP